MLSKYIMMLLYFTTNPPTHSRYEEFDYNDDAINGARFITSSWKEINESFEFRTNYTYYPQRGKVSAITNPDKLEIQYNYDDFGKLKSVEHSDETITKTELDWASGHPYAPVLPLASFYQYSYTDGAMQKTDQQKHYTFYDKFQREIRSVTFDINDDPVFVDTYYNNEGLVDNRTIFRKFNSSILDKIFL